MNAKAAASLLLLGLPGVRGRGTRGGPSFREGGRFASGRPHGVGGGGGGVGRGPPPARARSPRRRLLAPPPSTVASFVPATAAGRIRSTSVPRGGGAGGSESAPRFAAGVDAISISDAYDGGNGEFVSARIIDEVDDDCDLRVDVRIRPDPDEPLPNRHPIFVPSLRWVELKSKSPYSWSLMGNHYLFQSDGRGHPLEILSDGMNRLFQSRYTHLEQKQHFQYFSFRSTINPTSPAVRGIFHGKKSLKVRYILVNAGEASYSDAFHSYVPFTTASSTPFDPDEWSRVESDVEYANGCLTWTHVHPLGGGEGPGPEGAYFAYFPPYSYERHLGLIARCADAEGARATSIGQTLSWREIDCVTVGTGSRTCWIIHRQHPGESMASFYAEGLLNRLLGLDDKWDKVAEKAREMFTFHIVPNVNPDGSTGGYLRTNAAGSNLNREWCPSPAPAEEGGDASAPESETYEAPTLDKSPEVYNILRRMDETGCDAFLDVHGDEALPFNFLAGSQGMKVWGKRLEALHGAFLASYCRANLDMQSEVSYEPDEPLQGMSNICSNQIAERFDCLAATLEMPFKEIDGGEEGWGPERARRLGASALDALCYVRPYLREGGDFWQDLPEEDAYVCPSNEY
ncbi:hypothetical protein ACHAWF_013590 [Thalassiosira exigua]